MLQQNLIKTRGFILPFLFLLVALSALLLYVNRVDVELWVNSHNNRSFDLLFRYATMLGDGVAALTIVLIISLFNLRRGFILLLSYSISGILIQLVKNFIFPGIDRPLAVMGPYYMLHLVEGVKVWSHQSFPSGHAGTAFAIFFCLAAWSGRISFQFLSFIMASFIAYSRIYLLQHFITDVMAGAVIGTLTALCLISWLDKNEKLKFLDKSVLKFKSNHVQ
jgi:membrane-associated phospholipid phosphatase